MLKILVCIKEVADDAGSASIDSGRGWISSAPGAKYRMNLYDEYALEEAVAIKEMNPGTTVDVISLGPERASGTLRKALEKGADNAYRRDCDDSRLLTPGEKAAAIAGFAAPRGYGLIFTGVVSEDTMNGQVGPMLASLLGISFLTSVVCMSLDASGSSLEAESELEGGARARCRMELPALLAVQSGINTPRYPSLSNKLRAKAEKIDEVTGGKLPGREGREIVRSLSYRERISRGMVIEGSRHDKAEALIRILHEHSFF